MHAGFKDLVFQFSVVMPGTFSFSELFSVPFILQGFFFFLYRIIESYILCQQTVFLKCS